MVSLRLGCLRTTNLANNFSIIWTKFLCIMDEKFVVLKCTKNSIKITELTTLFSRVSLRNYYLYNQFSLIWRKFLWIVNQKFVFLKSTKDAKNTKLTTLLPRVSRRHRGLFAYLGTTTLVIVPK